MVFVAQCIGFTQKEWCTFRSSNLWEVCQLPIGVWIFALVTLRWIVKEVTVQSRDINLV